MHQSLVMKPSVETVVQNSNRNYWYTLLPHTN
jgi:hypothetical protein